MRILFAFLFLTSLPFFAQAQWTPRGTLDMKTFLEGQSVATFEKGELTMGNLITFTGKESAIIVLYDNIAPWAEPLYRDDLPAFLEQEPFHIILEDQNLVLVKSFELDEMNNGFILEAKDPNVQPDYVEAARILSEVDYVLKVHLKAAKE